jgi:hypothetical protein
MVRRRFLQTLGALGVIVGLPWLSESKTVAPAAELPSIGDLFVTSYPEALKACKGGRSWVSRELEKLESDGRITIRFVAACVQTANGLYPVTEIAAPIIWTTQDERRCNTETKRISFVSCLIENGLAVHDDFLLEKIHAHTGRVAVSKHCQYWLSGVSQPAWLEGDYTTTIYTVLAFID